MPLGEEHDELLSGYIDGRLTREELEQVESALADAAVQSRLDRLRGVVDFLREAASEPVTQLSPDFASRVMAACRALEPEGTASEDSDSVPSVVSPPLPTVLPALSSLPAASGRRGGPERKRSIGRRTRQLGLALAGLAAMLFLAVLLPPLFYDSSWFSNPVNPLAQLEDVTFGPETDSGEMRQRAESGGVDLLAGSSVSEIEHALESQLLNDFSVGRESLESAQDLGRMASERGPVGQIQFALVLDVELATVAREQQVIKSLLEKYGIDSLRGLRPNERIEAAIARMRFTVQEGPKARPAEIYLIRAPGAVLDAMLGEIQADVDLFPSYRYDLAFQTPTLSLSQAIADAIEESDALPANFALALVDQTRDSHVEDGLLTEDGESEFRLTPFEAIPYQGNLVGARRQRERFDAAVQLDSGENQSFLLLLAR
jgi:hypothetical protein